MLPPLMEMYVRSGRCSTSLRSLISDTYILTFQENRKKHERGKCSPSFSADEHTQTHTVQTQKAHVNSKNRATEEFCSLPLENKKRRDMKPPPR